MTQRTHFDRFECHTPGCSLGSRVSPGIFTGGITKEGAAMLTGAPVESFTAKDEGKTWGDGVCPNCGGPGTKMDDGQHVSHVGSDPYQPLHDEIAARVADPNDTLTAENAQSALEALVDASKTPAVAPTTEKKEVEEDEGK